MSLITVKDVSFSYEGSTVIEGLNFTVESGGYLCVVGENGSGKSTLMKGLLKLKAPSKGSIVMGDGLTAGQIGYLPQQTPAQKDFPGSVFEVALSGLLNSGGKTKLFYSRGDKKTAEAQLERLGILSLKNRCYRELSGGQQQRTLLARALCATQKLLLLDEPVAGLDPLATHELYEAIMHLNRDSGVAVIMVSHDIQSSLKYADKILHLKAHQAFFGSRDEYIRSAAARQFLGGESL